MLSEAEVARDIYIAEERGPSRLTRVPEELAFENILMNNTPSPCSLNEFMDYLVCEEDNAELLQFFTWFCHYIERWSELTPQEKSLSPPWKPTNADNQSGSPVHIHTHRRAESMRLDQILDILDRRTVQDNDKLTSDQSQHKKATSDSTNFSTPRRLPGIVEQPFRQDISGVIKHYIQGDAPRKLGIPNDYLAECLDATEITTHPSAFLPVFTATETILKSRCHPNFIRKSQCNASKPRLIFTGTIAVVTIVLGFAMSVVLISSSLSHFYRLIALILWWPGFTLLIAAVRNLCMFLYIQNLRQLWPWEQTQGAEITVEEDSIEWDEKKEGGFSDPEVKITQIHSANNDDRRNDPWLTDRTPSRASLGFSNDPLRKPSMQVFGGANRVEREARTAAYGTKSVWYKIWDDTVRTQSSAVRLLQNRIVILSVCWGGAISIILTVGSVFVPVLNIF